MSWREIAELVVLGLDYCQWGCVSRALSSRPTLRSMYMFVENSASVTRSVVTVGVWVRSVTLDQLCGQCVCVCLSGIRHSVRSF